MRMMKKAKTRAAKSPLLFSDKKISAALSTVQTSKYHAETEKNLDKLLAAATSSNTTLILDDADALFGQRSPTKPQ